MPLSNIITGVNSGLGKYLHTEIGGSYGLRRNNLDTILSLSGVDTIIHCAFDAKREVDNYYRYFNDNLHLTKQLLKVPHKKFIYVSSIDVYRNEESNYKLMKLMAESIVANESKNYLIARCSAMLGQGMRANTLTRIRDRSLTKTGLSSNSTFNYITYRDICQFFTNSIRDNLTGVYNVVASDNISLKQVSEYFDYYPEFGDFTYSTPTIYNNIPDHISEMGKTTSLENIKRFIEDND